MPTATSARAPTGSDALPADGAAVSADPQLTDLLEAPLVVTGRILPASNHTFLATFGETPSATLRAKPAPHVVRWN